jgi:hypothetical protein
MDHISCRAGCKITLDACLKRQIAGERRYKAGGLNPAFITCADCEHWLPDTEYNRQKRSHRRWNDRPI